ncbi:MAG: FAD-dependent oxidoreductase [Opitutales bacterium]
MADQASSETPDQRSEHVLHLDVAILGGGFAGVYCAKSLIRQLGRNSGKKIGVLAEENYMVFQPMLPEVAGAALDPSAVINPIRQLCRGAEFYKGKVSRIDWPNRSLTLNAGDFSPNAQITYDHLVLTLGATIDLSRVPGMPEHAFLMQNAGDALKLRTTIISRFEEANIQVNPVLKKRLLTFVVVGGGYSGVETAGQIIDLFTGMHPYYNNIDRDDFRVVLVHSRDHLLPTLSRRLGDYSQRKLETRGLEIILERRVKALTANHVYLDNGDSFDTATVVSTVGNAPHPLVQQVCSDCQVPAYRGRIRTDATMNVPEHAGLWAAGDCAAVPLWDKKKNRASDEQVCPPTAQFAMRQGTLLGRNIASRILGKGKSRPFRFTGLGELAAIGHRKAVADVLGIQFSGFFAWWLWRTIYLGKLPGVERKLRVMLEWTFDLFFPRDISVLNPRYTKATQEMHLETDNILFHPGEPAFSFYIVKSGKIDLFEGDNRIMSIHPGEFFGERALLEDGSWRFRAIAAEPTRLVALNGETFRSFFGSSAYFQRLLKRSAQKYRSGEDFDALKKQLPKWLLARPVESIMHRGIHALTPQSSVQETLRLFKESRHSLYPVKDPETGKFLGAFRRDDFYDYIKTPDVRAESTLEQLPLRDIPQVHPETLIEKVLQVMVREGANKIFVTEDGQLAGIVTIMDLLDAMNTVPEEAREA